MTAQNRWLEGGKPKRGVNEGLTEENPTLHCRYEIQLRIYSRLRLQIKTLVGMNKTSFQQ